MVEADHKKYSRIMLLLRRLARRRRICRDLKSITLSCVIVALVSLISQNVMTLVSSFAFATGGFYLVFQRRSGPISPLTEARRLEKKYTRFHECLSTVCSYTRGGAMYSQGLYHQILREAEEALGAVRIAEESPLKAAVLRFMAAVLLCGLILSAKSFLTKDLEMTTEIDDVVAESIDFHRDDTEHLKKNAHSASGKTEVQLKRQADFDEKEQIESLDGVGNLKSQSDYQREMIRFEELMIERSEEH